MLLIGGHGAAMAQPGTGRVETRAAVVSGAGEPATAARIDTQHHTNTNAARITATADPDALAPALAAASATPPPWQLDVHGLADAEMLAARTLLADAFARMPPGWRDPGHAPIAIAFRDDLPDDVHGRARAGRITLPRALLDGWAMRDRDAGLADLRARAAVAAVLHEVAHVRDRGDGSALSRDPRLRDLAGWQRQPLRAWRGRNAFLDRSPDAYELASPAEFVAVNVEHFLLDPAYGCRRPALYRHFADALSFAPPVDACAPGVPLVEAPGVAGAAGDDAGGAGGVALSMLDPARVHAVEYLLAGGDDGGAGRFGHTMLRLVVCAPGRPRGPDCRYDLAHHRVLSFRAQVDDVQVSSWRGLTGDYPSRLFVLPLQQVVDDYTRVQLRDLRSLPLALSDAEIARLLERAASLHWSYDGRYAFIGNNCAVETWKLLHDALPRLAAAPLRSVTPKGLLRRLVRAGIADMAMLDDDARARRLGYRFASARDDFDALYAVARRSAALPVADAGDWIALPAAERAPHIEAVDTRGAAALLVLEHAALRRQEGLGADVLKRRLLQAAAAGDPGEGSASPATGAIDVGANAGDGPGAVAGAASRADADARTLVSVRRLLREAEALSRPASLLPPGSGYGLPQQAERAILARQAGAVGTRLQGLADLLRGDARRALPRAQREELDAGEANLARLGVRLRALSHASSGLPASAAAGDE